MPEPITWVLALNAGQARILRGVRRNGRTDSPEIELHSDHRKLQEIMSDKPGRSFASAGGGRRSAIEYASDPVRDADRAFAREVAERLEGHHRAGEFERLAIFAAPDMLGLLREVMPASLRDAVTAEEAKNLMHERPADLARIAAEALYGLPEE